MGARLEEYGLFWREFRRTFQSTGAVLPSGRQLARALACHVGRGDAAQHVLEVGPGTGAVTGRIISRLGPEDRLDLVELNPRFADVLRGRLVNDPRWASVAERVQVLELPVEQLDAAGQYQVIVSGLPLNNFPIVLVTEIFDQFHRLADEGASLSFFEYVAIRKMKSPFVGKPERNRLAEIARLIAHECGAWETRRQCIVANVPPAWVHHLRLPGATKSSIAAEFADAPACPST